MSRDFDNIKRVQSVISEKCTMLETNENDTYSHYFCPCGLVTLQIRQEEDRFHKPILNGKKYIDVSSESCGF